MGFYRAVKYLKNLSAYLVTSMRGFTPMRGLQITGPEATKTNYGSAVALYLVVPATDLR